MRSFDKAQVIADLTGTYPEVMRLAMLLTGREDVARGVAKFVMSRAVAAWPTWETPEQMRGWFFHHALLTSRRAVKHRPTRENEFLLQDTAASPQYAAFVAALRDLPFQQAEAWLLFDVLDLDIRGCSVAMDCSTAATQNHLTAARTTLHQLAGDHYPALLERVRETTYAFTPDEAPAVRAVEKTVRRYLLPKRVEAVLIVLILAAITLAAWKLWPMVEI
jgi:DNA-directed RNA polymerase specialized sigma24 family protein